MTVTTSPADVQTVPQCQCCKEAPGTQPTPDLGLLCAECALFAAVAADALRTRHLHLRPTDQNDRIPNN